MSKNLFNLLCQDHSLLNAWKSVKQKGSSGGIDGISISYFEQNLDENIKQLQEELKGHRWEPEPYMHIQIPKKNNEKRTLGLLCVKDKIVQLVIKQLIEPRFEKEFVSNSYAYRPNKGHTKAIKFTKACVQNKKFKYVLRLDVDNYFDNINHEILFKRIAHLIPDDEINRLVQLCVKMGMVNKQLKWGEITKGVHQGAILSPILANYYLHSFDQFVLSKTKLYVRYADDFIIGCSSQEEAETLLKDCTTFLNDRLKLQLNTPVITDIKQGVEFLGITITKESLSISKEKEATLKERISSIDWVAKGFNEEGLEKLDGINNYYACLLPQETLVGIDNYIINHLENVIRQKHKSIPNKSTLISALKKITLFSDDYILRKSTIHQDLVNLYLTLKSSVVNEQNERANKKVILKKKHEYRQKENESSELIINTYGTFVGVNNKGISIKVFGKKREMPPSTNLHHITILSDGVSISSNVLSYCMNKNIGIDFFSATGKHVGSFLSMKYMHNSLWQQQKNLSIEFKCTLAKTLIRGKIKNQLNLIKYFHKYHKDKVESLVQRYDTIIPQFQKLLSQLKQIEESEKYIVPLVNIEAQTAELYWSYIKELIKDDDVQFDHRERKGATDLVNCLLNYGYSILYARIWRAVLAKKLNPTESVIHVPQPGKPTLVYDIIELFRAQAVDRVVITLIQKKEHLKLEKGLLDNQTKSLLIKNISERLNRYEQYRNKECKLCDIIKLQVSCIADYIENQINFKPYIAKW